MCAWCESRSRWSRSLTWQPGHKPTRTPNYCDSLDREGVSYYVERGSMCPTCGSTLRLGSPHKNSGLGRCSTRQPTVYSYTASHRSPCIRVDSPTHFTFINTMFIIIPTHIVSNLIVPLSMQ